ncbi:MAG: lipid-binding SYLF domain-containing protein [Gammaproteobacteria bacterium]
MNRIRIIALVAASLMLCACAASTSFRTSAANAEVKSTILVFAHADPVINTYLHHAYAYAVFPTIGKGGFIVAGAHGLGQVFKGGAEVGTASVTQLSVGFLVGGEAYREIIFFMGPKTFKQFTGGRFTLSAKAQATAITAGASASAGYGAGQYSSRAEASVPNKGRQVMKTNLPAHGYRVFTMVKGGLYVGVSVAGQSFAYTPG